MSHSPIYSHLLSSFLATDSSQNSKAQSLSLQFAIHEIIHAYDITKRFSQIISKNIGNELDLLFEHFKELLSLSAENLFKPPVGSLNKLLFYCDVLIENSNSSNDLENHLYILLENIRSAVLIEKTELHSMHKRSKLSHLSERLAQFAQFIQSKLKEIFHLLIPFIEKNAKDENVLYCLLNRSKELDLIIAPNTISGLLERFFSDREELVNYIRKKYLDRGFSQFIKANLVND